MIKKLLPITALLLFVMMGTSIAQEVNIGYMDTQQVLEQLPERERVEKELQSFIDQKQEELSERATAFQDEVAAYQENRTDMTTQQIQQREEELGQMEAELDQFDQTLRQQIEQKRQELLSPILDRIDKAIAAVAEAEGLEFVLNRSTSGGNPLIFYASENQVNITDQVLSRLTSSNSN